MFSLKDFIKNGFIKAVGKMADYQIILNAAGWLEKGVLDENDLMEIQAQIDEQYVVHEPVIEEEIIEEDYPVEEEIFDDEEPIIEDEGIVFEDDEATTEEIPVEEV